MKNEFNLLRIDSNIESQENCLYLKDLKTLGYSNIKCFKNIEGSINFIKTINFDRTKIIISGKLFIQFILKFKEKMRELLVIPKIIVFTSVDKKTFIDFNKNYVEIINHPFYDFGGITTTFSDIKKFLDNKKMMVNNQCFSNSLKNDNNIIFALKTINNKEKFGKMKKNNIQLVFEYIDCLEKLELPLLYQSLIDLIKIDNLAKYNELLYSKYSNKNKIIELYYMTFL